MFKTSLLLSAQLKSNPSKEAAVTSLMFVRMSLAYKFKLENILSKNIYVQYDLRTSQSTYINYEYCNAFTGCRVSRYCYIHINRLPHGKNKKVKLK
jgi:hypothetical protein